MDTAGGTGVFGQSIRTTNTTPSRMSVFDIIQAVTERVNPRGVWTDLVKVNPEWTQMVQWHQFPGKGQRATPVVSLESARIIVRSALCSQRSLPLAVKRQRLEEFGCDMTDIGLELRMVPETEAIHPLMQIFAAYQPIRQHRVGQYRVDLYLPTINIAVECDEGGHRFYQDDEEAARQQYIEQCLGCRFVRFDPHRPGFNIASVAADIVQLLYQQATLATPEQVALAEAQARIDEARAHVTPEQVALEEARARIAEAAANTAIAQARASAAIAEASSRAEVARAGTLKRPRLAVTADPVPVPPAAPREATAHAAAVRWGDGTVTFPLPLHGLQEKPVYRIDGDGQLYYYNSEDEAVTKVRESNPRFSKSALANCLHLDGDNRKAGGFAWKRVPMDEWRTRDVTVACTEGPIHQLTLCGMLVNKYTSVAKAAQAAECANLTMKRAVDSGEDCRLYIWRRVDDDVTPCSVPQL